MLCALRLTNVGFVQCLHLGSLWNFARVCFYVLRASPRKHRVCAVLFPRPLLSLYACLSCFVMRTLHHKHRVCVVLFSRFPFKKFVRLCFSRFVMRIFPHKHRVCAVPFPRPPVKFVCLSLSSYVTRTSPHKHQFCKVLFSGSYIGHVLSKQSNLFLHFLSTSKRFSRLSVPDTFYKSRKARSQRAIAGTPFVRKYFHNLRTLVC